MLPPNIILVEDDRRLRASLEKLLPTAQPPLTVVGSWGSVAEALAATADGTLKIAVALIDLKLADGSGLSVVRALRKSHPLAASVVLTVFEDSPTVMAAIRAGASGYLLKNASPNEIASRVHEAARGEAPLSPSVAAMLIEHVRGEQEPLVEALSARESDVLALLCEGLSYIEAAERLHVKVSTLQTHVKAIYRKLDVRSKAELTASAFRRGLVH